ncbi:MAG TPA: DUF5698 domain-containing protein [Longimicrobiaceae bacterium]|jgi:uncharacterized protein YebE (UPF0316 family)|nr:DUF5698 domain-containing protein [Longimicrobiaceae bacterium]
MPLDALLASHWGPLIIFCLRLIDVPLSTIRMLLAVRGFKNIAPVIGFFEVLTWVVAVGTAIKHLDSPLHLIGYAAGFAAGVFVGLQIEEYMALGMASVRAVARVGGVEFAEALRARGFGVTEFGGQGREGSVEVVDAVVRRRDLPIVFEELKIWAPEAFVTVAEPRSIHRGWLLQGRKK